MGRGAQYPKEGDSWGHGMYCLYTGNNQMLDKVGVIVGLDKSDDDSIRGEEVDGMEQIRDDREEPDRRWLG